MATENRGVMVYLPPEVEEYMTNFCTEYNITRKDKEGNVLPSLGTGVVTYLKSKMSGESPDEILTKPSKSLGNGLSKDEVLDLIKESNTSHSLSNGLTKDEVLDLIREYVTSDLLSDVFTKTEVLDLIKSELSSTTPLVVEATAPLTQPAESRSLGGLRHDSDLSKRIETNARDLKSSIEDESKDVQRAYRLLTELDGLKDAFVAAVAVHGKSSYAIADDLFAQNTEWGRDSQGERRAYSIETVSRMRKALAYIERE
jgi:hypothetical protein